MDVHPYGMAITVSAAALYDPLPLRGRWSLRCRIWGHDPETLPEELIGSLPAGFLICARCGYSTHAGGFIQVRCWQAKRNVDRAMDEFVRRMFGRR